MIQKTYHNCGILFMKIGVKYGHNNENIDICIEDVMCECVHVFASISVVFITDRDKVSKPV